MKNTITIQDIANALNMSRNTVSKALNGKHVPAKTRNAVINAAIEMGYKGYKFAAAAEESLGQKRFLILSSRLLMNMNYYIFVLRSIEESLADYDIELEQMNITNTASFAKFKRYLADYKVDGIICIEFFKPDYISDLVLLGVPLVFLDFPLINTPIPGKYDIILPESQNIIKSLCMHLIRDEGCQTFGFVGDYRHCQSFYERFTGMREALFLSGLPVDLQYSILIDDSTHYDSKTLVRELSELPALPDCFIAANDFIAINLLHALKTIKKQVPKDVKVVGFDNITESKHSTPPLTSVNVNKSRLGHRIVSLLMRRIADPTQEMQILYISSKEIIRSST